MYNKNCILLLGIIIDNIIAILFLIPNHQTKWVVLRKTMFWFCISHPHPSTSIHTFLVNAMGSVMFYQNGSHYLVLALLDQPGPEAATEPLYGSPPWGGCGKPNGNKYELSYAYIKIKCGIIDINIEINSVYQWEQCRNHVCNGNCDHSVHIEIFT